MPAACAHDGAALERLFPARDYITGDEFWIAQCGACGLMVTTPVPDAALMARYYPAAYYGGAGGARFPSLMERLQDWLYGMRARQVEALAGRRAGRVLDIGCGRGHLLARFRRRGWEVFGTELTETAAAFARDVHHLPVQVGTMDEVRFPAGHFDAVVLWHVLEHVPVPVRTLAAAARVLRPGGILMVAVPNAASPEARSCRGKWFHLDVPRHQAHFTWSTLRQALAQAGLRERRASGLAPEYDAFSFTQSALNRLGLRQNLLYNLLRMQGAKVVAADGVAPLELALTLALAVPLGIVSVPATALLGVARLGGTMTIWAEKR